ncbi:hypothetical protein TGRUB_271010 [Toxoplasma gondii RUB]|uniref:Uncharacterized protein n=1 Tax=Toxoplasma gondii RUB TaxID=935652 RepID=A0A086LYG3_TOXGO|nr:hypothetical protein TGRUB_271010 [Toxoplasma gondii RUB]
MPPSSRLLEPQVQRDAFSESTRSMLHERGDRPETSTHQPSLADFLRLSTSDCGVHCFAFYLRGGSSATLPLVLGLRERLLVEESSCLSSFLKAQEPTESPPPPHGLENPTPDSRAEPPAGPKGDSWALSQDAGAGVQRGGGALHCLGAASDSVDENSGIRGEPDQSRQTIANASTMQSASSENAKVVFLNDPPDTSVEYPQLHEVKKEANPDARESPPERDSGDCGFVQFAFQDEKNEEESSRSAPACTAAWAPLESQTPQGLFGRGYEGGRKRQVNSERRGEEVTQTLRDEQTRRGDTEEFKECLESTVVQRTTDDGSASDLFPSRHCSSASSCVSSASLLVSPAPLHASPPPPSSSTSAPPTASSSTGSCPPYCASTCASNSSPFPTFVVTRAPFHSSSCFLPSLPPSATPVPSSTSSTPGPPASFPASYRSSSSVQPGSFPAPYLYSTSLRSSSTQSTSAASSASFSSASVRPSLLAPAACSASHALRCGSSVSSSSSDCRASSAWQFPSARDGPPAERAGSVASTGRLFDLATHCRAGKSSAKKLHALKRDRRAGVDAAISLEESKLKRQELRRQGRRKKRRRESARSALRCCTYLGDELRRSCRAFFRRRLIDEFFARYSREEERLWLEFGLSRGRRTTGVHREGEGHLVPERETVPWASGGSSACPFSASSDSSLSVQCPAERRSASSNAFLTTTPSVAKQTKKRKAERCTDTEECCLSTPDTEEGVFSRKRTAVLDERETAAATGAPVPQIRVCDFWFCLDWTSSSSPGAADERTSAAAQTARTSEEPVLRRKRDRSAESAVADPQSIRKLRGHVRARDGRLQEERNGGEEEKLRVTQSEKGEESRRNEEGGQGDEAGCEEVEGEGFVFASGREEALRYGKEVLKREEGDSKKRGDQRQICAEEDACANEAERDRGEATRQKGVGRRSQRGDRSPRGNGNQGDEAPSEVPGTCDSGEKTERLVKRSGGCSEGAKHKRGEAREEGKAAAHRPLSCAEERRETVWKSVRVSEGKEPRVLGRQEAMNRETGEGGDEANEDERRGKESDGWDIHWTKKRSGDSKGRVQTERGEQNLKKCQEERKRCLEVTDAGDSECGSEAEREKKEKHQDMNEHAQTQRTTRRDVDGSCVTSLKVETNSSEEKKTATTERGTEHSFADLHSAQRWLAASFSSEDASEASDEAQKRERRDHPRHVEDEEEELTREIPENKASKRENDSSGCGVALKKTDESKESDLTRGMLVSTRYQRQSKTGCCQSGFSSCDSPPPFSHMASQALDRFFAFFALAPGNSFLQAFPGEAIWHHRDETISSSDAREAEHPCGCASLRSACPSAFPSPVSSLASLCFPVSLSEEKIHYAVPRKEEKKRIRGTSNEWREQRAGLWSGLIEAGCRQCEREEENGLTTRLSSAEEETSREERQTSELEEERGDGKREGEPQKEPFAENEQPSKSRHSPQKVAKELDSQSGSLDGAKHLGKGRDESTEGFRKSKPACKAENCEVRKEARRAENDKTRERDRRQEQEGMRSSAYESGITNEEIQRENDSGTSFLDTAIRQSLLWDALFSSWYDEAHIRGKDRRASADSTDDDRLTFDGPHCSSVFSFSQKVAESRRRRVRKLLCRGLEVLDRVIEAINEEKYRSATISEDASGTAGKANGAVDEGRTEEERSRENVTPGEDARCLLKTRTTEEQEATGGQAGEAKRTHDSAEEDDLGRSSEPSMEMSTGLCALESSVSAAPRSRSSRPPNDASPSTLSRRDDAQDPGTSNLSSFERPFSLSAAQFPSFSDSSLSSSAVPSSASRVSSSSPASAVSRSSLPYPFLTERVKTEEGVERLRANEVKDETEQGKGKGKDPFSPGAVRDAKSRTQSSEEGHRQNCLHFPKLESGKCDDSSLSKLTGPSVTLSDSSVTLSHSVSTPVPSAPQSFTCILEPLPKETETGCPLYRAEPSPTVFHSAKNLSCRSPSHVASFLSLTKASVSPKTEANLAFASISCESHCESDAEALRPSSDHQHIPSQPQCCSSGSYSSGLANNSPLSIHSVRAHPPPSSCKTETYAFCVEAGPANKLCRHHVLRQERDFETPASPSFQQQGMSDSEKQTRHERGEKESNGKSEKSEAAAGEEGTDRGKGLAESSGYEAGGGKKCGEGGTERQGKETRTGGGWEEGICQ